MSAGRNLPLLLVALLLVAAAVYLGVVVGSDPEEGLAFPGDLGRLIEPTDPPPARLTGAVATTVTLELEPTARLLEPWRPPRLRVVGAGGAAAIAVWVAGSAAVPGGHAGGYQLARIDLPAQRGAPPHYRVVHLARGQEEFELTLDGPHTFAARVLDAAGAAVPAADVWMAGRAATTDAGGRFVIEGLSGRIGLPLVLRAPGKASHFRVVDLPDGGAAESRFVLEDGVTLQVRFAGSLPLDGAARVMLQPSREAADGSLGLLHYPFFWPAVAPDWTLDAQGSCRLDGLPRDVHLEVLMCHGRLITTDAATVHLRAAAQTVFVRGVGGPVVEGVVVDQRGDPVAGVHVRSGAVAAHSRAGSPYLLPAEVLLRGGGHVRTTADGRFAIVRPARRDAVVTLHGIGFYGTETSVRGNADLTGQRFVLPTAGVAACEPALRLTPTAATRLVVVRGSSRNHAISLPAGRPYMLRLREPVLMNVTVRRDTESHTLRDVAVWGATDLPLE